MIDEAQLVDDKDYWVFLSKTKNPAGGRPETDYYLSRHAIDPVFMKIRGPLGRVICDWFADRADEYRNRQQPVVDFSNPVETAQLVVNLGNQVLAQHGLLIETRAEVAETKHESADRPARQLRQPVQRDLSTGQARSRTLAHQGVIDENFDVREGG